jgi:hypothetical protein
MNNPPFDLLKAFMRLLGLEWFLSAVLLVLDLPELLVQTSHRSELPLSADVATTGLFGLVLRFAIYCAIGAVFWFRADWLARFVSGSKVLIPAQRGESNEPKA